MEHGRDTGEPPRSPGNQPRRGSNKWIGRAFILLWVVGVIAVYVVIVRLKAGGEKALRLPEPPEQRDTSAVKPDATPSEQMP